jgi:hypothetical protein
MVQVHTEEEMNMLDIKFTERLPKRKKASEDESHLGFGQNLYRLHVHHGLRRGIQDGMIQGLCRMHH